jgi:transcriptional regulator with XRE-family HTH domain
LLGRDFTIKAHRMTVLTNGNTVRRLPLMVKAQFGELLREARTEHGMSLRSLSAQSGIEFSRLSRMEHGTRPAPALAEMRTLAELLSLNLADLLVAAGTRREAVEQLLWAERLRSIGEVGTPTEAAPRILRAVTKNRFCVNVVEQAGEICTVQLGTERWTILSLNLDDEVQMEIPPEAIQLFARDPVPILCAPHNVFSAVIVKTRTIGSLRNVVVLVGGVEINVVLLAPLSADDGCCPGSRVYAAVPASAILVRAVHCERK